MTVESLATELSLWSEICKSVESFAGKKAKRILQQLSTLPVKPSRATRRLGSCSSKNGVPVCLRLQFEQEPENLKQTLLHEIAHVCDQLTVPGGLKTRPSHGPQWQAWAQALGTSTKSCGHSEALNQLHRKRLKLVAVCQRCGAEFRRVRRLNRCRDYYHTACGGSLRQI